MQRATSRMTGAGLEAFLKRWGLTKAEAAKRLGMSDRTIYAHIQGTRKIPKQLAILISALDELWTMKQRDNSEKQQ